MKDNVLNTIYLIGETAVENWIDPGLGLKVLRIDDPIQVNFRLLNNKDIFMVVLDIRGDVSETEEKLILKLKEKKIFFILLVEGEYEYKIKSSDPSILIFSKPMDPVNFNCIVETMNYCNLKKDEFIQTHQYYQSYFNKSQVGMALRSMDGKLFNINREFCKMLGYEKEELIGKTADFFIHEDNLRIDKLMLESLMRGESESTTREIKYLKKNGETVWGLLNLSIERGLEDKPLYFFAQVQNITRLKMAEKQLRQASKMEAIGTLAGGIAHDFNNILGVIYGFSELVMDELDDHSPGIQYVEKIINSADKAKDLVYQILKFSRGVESKNTSIRVIPLIKEFLKLLRSVTPANISIKSDMSCTSDNIFADPMQFQQVLMHICTNANEAMKEEGGKLDVLVDDHFISNEEGGTELDLPTGEYLKISIGDTGKGMDLGIENRIFDPYYSTNEQSGASGLSLAITYKIVRDFGGSIDVNTSPGKGTVFNVYLPKIKENNKAETGSLKYEKAVSERILFVDDEENLVEIGEKILIKAGYRVTAVSSSIRALNLFKENPKAFDLVISDMTMTDMTGLQMFRKLARIRPSIPVIICTGYSKLINNENFRALGIAGMLMKPVGKEKLLSKIREVLDPL